MTTILPRYKALLALGLFFYRASSVSTMMEGRARDIARSARARYEFGTECARSNALRQYLTGFIHISLSWCGVVEEKSRAAVMPVENDDIGSIL
ncbi:hypothetical protein BKA65DRAFT_113758 [Rhexocercosporidium sp. MPI-PUGE-AT-0058]|nr:hypothetical protein BKA65DRAFT_113758 [Rhexocercosporidium sp. MPI-PUGE-AT-0058]